jgi:hypothetical protein
MSDADRSFASTIAYRQQARHLRAKLRNQPAALHRALSALNGASVAFKEDSDRSPAPAARRRPAPTEPAVAARPPTAARAAIGRPASSAPFSMVWALTAQRPTFDLGPGSAPLRLAPVDRAVAAPPRRHPAARSSAAATPAMSPTGPTHAAMERGFAAAVEQHLHGGVLRCNDRAALLRAADRMRLDRFRANLIIALVQRAAASGGSATDAMALAPAAGPIAVGHPSPSRAAPLIGWVSLAVLIEAAVAAAAWWMWM